MRKIDRRPRYFVLSAILIVCAQFVCQANASNAEVKRNLSSGSSVAGNYDGYISNAKASQLGGHYAEAYNSYKLASSLHPKDVAPQIGMALCLESLGEPEEASLLLEQTVKSVPSNKDLLLALAQIDFRMGNYQGSQDACQKVLDIAPKWYDALSLQANIQLVMSSNDLAADTAGKLIAIEPQNRLGYITLARCYFENIDQPGKEDAVLAICNRALPHDGQLYATIANSFQIKGNEFVKRSSPSDLEHARPWWQLAEQAYKKAVEDEPNNDSYRASYAQLLSDERKYVEALVQAEVALKLNPSNKSAQELEKKLHTAKGDLAGQLKHWLK